MKVPVQHPVSTCLVPPYGSLDSSFPARRRDESSRPVDQPHHSSFTAVHVPLGLMDAKYVYIRHDAIRRPLQHPYDRPFRVDRTDPKTFTADKNGQDYRVSIDRLKPAITPLLGIFTFAHKFNS